jgi:hypothetical protein
MDENPYKSPQMEGLKNHRGVLRPYARVAMLGLAAFFGVFGSYCTFVAIVTRRSDFRIPMAISAAASIVIGGGLFWLARRRQR